MADLYHPLFNGLTVPDGSGNVWIEPFDVAASNDVWKFLVWRLKDTSTRIGIRGCTFIPNDYNTSGTSQILVPCTSTAISGNYVLDFDYRAIGGDDAESMDQSGTQQSVTVTDAAPGASLRLLRPVMSITAGNLAPGDLLEWELFRDGADGSDTMAADLILFGAWLKYNN